MSYAIYPAGNFANVTPSDTAKLQFNSKDSRCVGFSINVAGDVALKDQLENTVVILGLAAGVIHPISTDQILATGTTATGITAYFTA